jgi:hypothetical protein
MLIGMTADMMSGCINIAYYLWVMFGYPAQTEKGRFYSALFQLC